MRRSTRHRTFEQISVCGPCAAGNHPLCAQPCECPNKHHRREPAVITYLGQFTVRARAGWWRRHPDGDLGTSPLVMVCRGKVAEHPDDPEWVILQGRIEEPHRCEAEPADVTVAVHRTSVPQDILELLEPQPATRQQPRPLAQRPATKHHDAVRWLRDYLTGRGGQAPVDEVVAAAAQVGFALRTLRRASRALPVTTVPVPDLWRLEPDQ